MLSESFLGFIEDEDRRLNASYGMEKDKTVLARTVKLGEEVGELCAEVLSSGGLQRIGKKRDGELEEELADVIITTFLLAKALDVGVGEALERKMKKIEKRYE